MKRTMFRKLSISVIASALLLASGCANRYQVDTEAPNYAAIAKIKVKVNKDENREMTLQIDHLAPPHKLGGTYRAYAVWIAVPGHGISKVGMLDYTAKKRRGELVATSPHAKFEVIVSLEESASTSQPSQQIVLRKLVTGA